MMLNGAVFFILNVSTLISPQCLSSLIPEKHMKFLNREISIKKHGHQDWKASGLEKRQCTLQVCTLADGKEPRITVIFRGKGKRVRPDEKAAWHPDVDVLWQENAWADKTVSVNWVNTTIKYVVKNLEKHVLFIDNLTAQQTDDFKKAVSDLKGGVQYG